MKTFQNTFLRLGLVIGTGLIVASCSSSKESEQDPRPNIIWLMAEDISTDLECYGTAGVQTPHLNWLAENGTKFENAYVTNSICSPSRSAMMVGVHQNQTNTQHHRSNRNIPLDTAYKPFTYWLRKAGYTTVLGHHGVMDKGRKTDVNFKHTPTGEWDGTEDFGLFDNLDTIRSSEQPFFAQIQLKATHRGDWWDDVRERSSDPVDPEKVELPPYMADDPVIRLDWAKYLDQMEYIDNEVGMIMEELEQKGLADNTIIIFIGDNGRCNIRGKGYLFEAGVHIPLIIYDPRKKGQKVNHQLVSATDITATVLEYAGANLPEYLTGTPIFKEGSGRSQVYSSRDLWDEVMEKSRAVTTDRWKYIRHDKPELPYEVGQAYLEFYRPAVHVMRRLYDHDSLSPSQAYFFGDAKPTEELYDLKNDPLELNNLALSPEYRTIKKQLREELNTIEKRFSTTGPLEIEHPGAVDVLKWLKEEKPSVYKQIQEGKEVGYKKYAAQYKKHLNE
ncbi:sulfatase [Echinicola strongylocentroti]|uniref:Sulfatase n=1 Tax=Echinicola strongylocentroti TaxID=1795355 RepID=A0A2Z4IQ97_9BACT|nr:sulfatase [Echinicola strongylocentroti]AWW32879.1 sulfatase [Echinicola strongylocentroti]